MKKGRPTEAGTQISVRLQAQELAALDAWRKEQSDLPTRPEAMRRLAAASLVENKSALEPQPAASPLGEPSLLAKPSLLALFREFIVANATADLPEDVDPEGVLNAAKELAAMDDYDIERALFDASEFLARVKAVREKMKPKKRSRRP